jgi:GNAT superfamily N-acetyltransferase
VAVTPAAGPAGSVLEDVAWDDPEATRLRDAQQAELRERYGDDDIGHTMSGESIVAMVLVRDRGEPVACGALRDAGPDLGAGTGELKRMYVVPAARGRGLAKVVLEALEVRASRLGLRRLVLETGVLQPEAIGLYLTAGYEPIPNFGDYVGVADSRCFAKDLGPGPVSADDAGTTTADDVAPTAESPDDVASSPTDHAGTARAARPAVTLRLVGWDDPVARHLRRRMFDEETVPRYPELRAHVERIGGFEVFDGDGADVLVTALAEVDGTVLGSATLRAARPGMPTDSAELVRVFVDRGARRAGVARALVRGLEDEARSRGLGRVVLHTGSRQPEAVRLYVGLGYRPIVPYPPYERDSLALCFERRLDEGVLAVPTTAGG